MNGENQGLQNEYGICWVSLFKVIRMLMKELLIPFFNWQWLYMPSSINSSAKKKKNRERAFKWQRICVEQVRCQEELSIEVNFLGEI